MAKRKTIVSKPSFVKSLGYYAIRFGVVAIALILAFGVFSKYFYMRECKLTADRACEKVYDKAAEYTRHYYNYGLTDSIKNNLRYELLKLWDEYSICSSIGIGSSFIASAEERLVLEVLRNDTVVPFFYYGDVDVSVEALSNLLDTLENNGIDYRDCDFVMDTAYLWWKQKAFIPGRGTAFDAETGDLIMSIDLSPDHPVYTVVDSSTYPMDMRFRGNSECNAHEFYASITEVDYLSNNNLRVIHTNHEYGELADQPGLNRHDQLISSDIDTLITGATVNLNMRSDYSYITKIYESKAQNLTTKATFVTVAVFVLLSFISAIIRFNNQKAVYKLFEYRRQTTDAMAHDLKTPLAIASACVENLKEDISEDKKDHYINAIDENIQYMNRLINDILHFSNSQYEESKVSKENVGIRESVDIVIEQLSLNCEAKKISIKITGEKTIKTDKKLWEQSISNLLTNAVKYSDENSIVRVYISDNEFTISNPANYEIKNMDRLLEPYVKGNAGRGQNTGSGLGLAIADNNLRKLGYKLSVDYSDHIFTAKITF